MQTLYKFLNNLPILPKLLLIPAVPLIFLLLLGAMLSMDVLTFFHDEERLNERYLLQKTAAQYMRSVADLETAFLGYAITRNDYYYEGFKQRQATLLAFERELVGKLPREEDQQFRELQKAVTKSVADKERFVEAIKAGSPAEAVRYIQEGKSREIMVDIRTWMRRFEEMEHQTTQQELSALNYDQIRTIFIIL